MATNNAINAPLPISAANGGTGTASPTAHTIPIAEGSSAFNFLGPLTNGQLLIGSTGADPVAATLTAGTNISITNGAGTITVNNTGGTGITWNDQTSGTVTMAVNNGYVVDNGASLVTLTLPATAALGSVFEVIGKSAGGWTVAQAAGQSIHIGNQTTTTTTGTLSSSNQYDCIRIVCITANTVFTVSSSMGNITYV